MWKNEVSQEAKERRSGSQGSLGYGVRTCLKVRAARITEFYPHGVRMMSLTQYFVARLQNNADYVPVWKKTDVFGGI